MVIILHIFLCGVEILCLSGTKGKDMSDFECPLCFFGVENIPDGVR